MNIAKYCFNYQFLSDQVNKWLFVIFIDNITDEKLKNYEFFNANKLFIEVPADIEGSKDVFYYELNCLLHHTIYAEKIEYSNVIIAGCGQGQPLALDYSFKYNFENLFLYPSFSSSIEYNYALEDKLIKYLNLNKSINIWIFTSQQISEALRLYDSKVQICVYKNGIMGLKRNILIQYMELFYKKSYQSQMYVYDGLENIEAYLECSFQNIEIAFYIFKDDERIETRWYSSEPYVSYMKQGQGVYKIAAFIKCELGMIVEEKAINCLSDVEKNYFEQLKSKNLKRYIDIHGSCVSRDLFNFSSKGFEFSKTYCARTSVFACLSNSNTKINKDYIELESKFRRRSLEYDLDKNVFTTLQQGKGNYLIIDLVDTVRFVLMKYEDSLFTGSTEFVDSKLSNYYNFERINPLNFSETEWKYCFSLYSKEIKKLYDEKNIIIHCVYFKNDYRTIDGQIKLFDNTRLKTNKIYNEVLKKWYTYLREILPNAIYIDICKQREYLADEKHHYGLAPVHYNDEYYLDVLKQLEEVLECNQ